MGVEFFSYLMIMNGFQLKFEDKRSYTDFDPVGVALRMEEKNIRFFLD